MCKKKKHIFLPNRNKSNKGIMEKAYEMNVAKPLHIMPLIENFLYGLCGVTANTSPLQGEVRGSNPPRSTNNN